MKIFRRWFRRRFELTPEPMLRIPSSVELVPCQIEYTVAPEKLAGLKHKLLRDVVQPKPVNPFKFPPPVPQVFEKRVFFASRIHEQDVLGYALRGDTSWPMAKLPSREE